MVKQRIPSANIQLTYPLYCCDFIDPHRLVVAGGGGPGRNGVGNKITVLDTSDVTQISEVSELELSPNEDNVMSLVVVGSQKGKPATTTVLAGVNSSPQDVSKGVNKHLRTLAVAQQGKSNAKPGGVKISETARDALFVHKDEDTYQRILRLSPSYKGLASSPRLGAAATGLSKQPQIVLFDVPSTNNPRWKTRGRLDPRVEAMDLDVIQTGPDTYQLAYCDDNKVFTVEVSKEEVAQPRCVYTIKPDDGETVKAAFKSLRYLTPGFLITVVNNPKSRGVSLHGLRLPTGEEDARLTIRAKLPKTVSKATSLAVRNLSPVASPSDQQGEAQFIIAVAGNDASISLFTVEHKSAYDSDILADLAPFQVIKSVHPSSITNLAISSAESPKGSAESSSQELFVKLASVSVGCSTVVHSIPIKKRIDTSVSGQTGASSKPWRYVVALKSKGESYSTAITLVSLIFLVLVLVGQVLLEAKHISEPILGVREYLPASWTEPIRKVPRVQVSEDGQKTIEKMLSDISAHHSQQVVIKQNDLGATEPNGLPALHVGVHDEETHGPATAWQNLDKADQDLWKQRLRDAGYWAEDMGENIFTDVLFGQIGDAIGNMADEAL